MEKYDKDDNNPLFAVLQAKSMHFFQYGVYFIVVN